jgi:23S rRNA pseudouridine1911/1915/1917 synthase
VTIDIIYEDNHLLVLNKPAGLITAQAPADQTSLWDLARDDLKIRYQKPGHVFLGVVSRLDRQVSGLVVFAKTSKAAARLNEQFRNRTIEKTYWAVVSTPLESAEGQLEDWLAEDRVAGKGSAVVSPHATGAKLARLFYRTLSGHRGRWLLEIGLETGRKHQIRVQLGSRGSPIVGDARYGSSVRFSDGIALLARSLSFRHPTRAETLSFSVDPPESWRAFRSLWG